MSNAALKSDTGQVFVGTTSGMANNSVTTTLGPTSGVVTRVTVESFGHRNIENAVYAHIRAMRELGKTQLNTAEIAEALGLSVTEVDSTLAALKKKGVKVLT